MSQVNLEQIIDTGTRNLIFGYFHEIENDLLSNNTAIPVGIIHLCIAYFWLKEEFNRELNAADSIISRNKATISRQMSTDIGSVWRSFYGTFIIDAKLYPLCALNWKIKFHKKKDCVFELGIIEIHETNNESINKNCILESLTLCQCYGLYGNNFTGRGRIILDCHNSFQGYKSPVDSDKIQVEGQLKDNIITMALNIKNKTLKFYINDNDYNLMYTKMDLTKQYRFVACLYNHAGSVEIMDFTICDAD
eukprot:300345_1